MASLGFLSGIAQAAEASPATVVTPHVRAHLVSERTGIEPGQVLWLALHFEIKKGWHTYWQNPGDSGAAPQINWTLPAGLSAGDIHWPYPRRLPVGPLMNYGYSDAAWMLIPIRAAALPVGQTLDLIAQAEWLVCEIECIPEHGEFRVSLPVLHPGQSRPSEWAARFKTIRQQLPLPSPWQTRVRVSEETLYLHLPLAGQDSSRLRELYFFPLEYGEIEHAAPQPYTTHAQEVILELPRGDLRVRPVQALHGVIVMSEQLPDGVFTRAFHIEATAAPAEPLLTVATMGLFALLGGVLLNLMPCVFPILSLKAMSIVRSAAQAPHSVRRNGYLFTLGVLLSFLVIALSLLILRAGGEAIGWGFQLQSAGFVLVLAWLMVAMGLLFSGLWSFGESWQGVGQTLTTRSGASGAFFTGVLAVIVATPCTAPFMGTALGYALSQPAWIALLIFLLLGLGMALPWLLISVWPGLSTRLPKPGVWMERAKQILAFPLYATAAWLLWVFAQQVESQTLLYGLISPIVLALALWLWQHARRASRRWRLVMWVTVLGLGVVLTMLVWNIQPVAATAKTTHSAWQPYDAQVVNEQRAAGRAVLVNFTAAWCITCLVNEKVALHSDTVQTQLKQRNVVLMKGDWTNKDPNITQVLSRYGRSGVPLYLLFPPAAQREPLILPNILTEGIVIEALQALD